MHVELCMWAKWQKMQRLRHYVLKAKPLKHTQKCSSIPRRFASAKQKCIRWAELKSHFVRFHFNDPWHYYQALLWWIFQLGKFLWEKATLWITLTFWKSSSKKIKSSLQKNIKWHRVSNGFFKLCTERALKVMCFSLQFYYLLKGVGSWPNPVHLNQGVFVRID